MSTDSKDPTELLDKKHNLILLIMEIFSQLDEIAALRKTGAKADLSRLLLKETCSILGELDNEGHDIYLDLLVKIGSKRELVGPVSIDEDYLNSVSGKRRDFVEMLKSQFAA